MGILIKTRIIESLENAGSATHNDLADELGLVPKRVSAYLCKMREEGTVRVVRRVKPEGGGRPANLWELTA